LIPEPTHSRFLTKRESVDREVKRLKQTRPEWTDKFKNELAALELNGVTPDLTLAQLLKRQELSYGGLLEMTGETGPENGEVRDCVEITVKYEGYIRRQLQQVAGFKKLEERWIPTTFNYDGVTGFSREVLEKFKRVRPASIGQASRISGVTPAAISLLLVALERDRRLGRLLKR